MLALLLALAAPATAARLNLGADVLHAAFGAPGLNGAALFTSPLQPGAQGEVALLAREEKVFGVGGALRVAGWSHSSVEGLVFLSAAARLVLRPSPEVSLLIEPLEVGGGLGFLVGERYTVGEDGLEQGPDAPTARLLLAAGLGLELRIPDSPWSLRLSYRAGLATAPPLQVELPFLPRSTLGLGLAMDLGSVP